MVVSIHNQYVTITINSNTIWSIELSLSKLPTPKCSDLLSTWTEDGDAVTTKLSHYDLSPLVDSHTPGSVDSTNGSDRVAEILHCNYSKCTSFVMSCGHSQSDCPCGSCDVAHGNLLKATRPFLHE